jgi:predicted AAA+ superfamily ATPase
MDIIPAIINIYFIFAGIIYVMIKRTLKSRILKLLQHFPVIAILGPRQVGKTTLAKDLMPNIKREVLYLDLELPVDINRLSNPQIFLQQNQDRCVIIDEIQRAPELFPVIRAVVDENRVPGRFIVLGSASPELLKQSSETLAGRIAYTELTGLTIPEIANKYTSDGLWLKGGFPQPFLMNNQEILFEWYQSFILTYIERDLPLLGLSANSNVLRRLISMLAHNQGTLLNLANFSKSLGISSPTVSKYLGFLENAFIIRLLQPWHMNIKKRLVRSPKTYIRDTGTLHHILGIDDYNALLGHPILGPSWEGFVIEQIIDSAVQGLSFSFYRTAEGAECDLVISKGIEILACIEVKFNDAPKTTKSFTTAIKDLQAKANYIIVPNCPEPYTLKDNIIVSSPLQFIQQYLEKL